MKKEQKQRIEKWLQIGFLGFISVIFLQSLWFKYGNSPETIYIFQEKLNPWAYALTGFNLFAPTGIFSQYVIGTAELVASIMLLFSLVSSRYIWLRSFGALVTAKITFGAILFHLFTPLGVSVQNVDGTMDGGALFFMACLCFSFGLYLFFRNHIYLWPKVSLFLPKSLHKWLPEGKTI